MGATLQTILDEDYLGDLTAVDMDDLRQRRKECKEVETGLSYLRRMTQGRLDIVRAEQKRRDGGGESGDLQSLIAELPSVLAENTRAPGLGRLTLSFDTGTVQDDLVDELDAIASVSALSDATEFDDTALAGIADELVDFERRVSDLRKQLFGRIDAIEDEITRRYRSGEASVDQLLG